MESDDIVYNILIDDIYQRTEIYALMLIISQGLKQIALQKWSFDVDSFGTWSLLDGEMILTS